MLAGGPPFDVVVTDRAMPEMHGDQLAVAIEAVAPQVPVVLLTGFGEFMQDAGERPAGVDCVLAKPVTIATLRAALEQVLA